MKVRTNNSAAGILKNNTEYEVVGSIRESGYFEFLVPEDPGCIHCGHLKNDGHLSGGNWTIVKSNQNREFLSDFLKLNNIKKTLVSKYLGYSENWLTQMANDKRRDMTDATLKSIMKKLHIDWSQDTFINVKSTKDHTAYRTKPSTYTTDMHKERLQRAMWDGELIR